jgi:hypothetical protein
VSSVIFSYIRLLSHYHIAIPAQPSRNPLPAAQSCVRSTMGPCLVSGAISTELLEGVYWWPKLIGSSQGGPAAAKIDKGQFPSDHMTVKPRKALRTMQTSLMLMNVTQLTRESAKEAKARLALGERLSCTCRPRFCR